MSTFLTDLVDAQKRAGEIASAHGGTVLLVVTLPASAMGDTAGAPEGTRAVIVITDEAVPVLDQASILATAAMTINDQLSAAPCPSC